MTIGKNIMNKIIFSAQNPWINKDSASAPKPTIKTLPEWYRKADRFFRNPESKEHVIGPDNGKILTYKSCPAMFDIMGSGYTLLTPCDIEFFNNKDSIACKILDPKYPTFCTPRDPMPQFENPHGYHQSHFAWFSNWSVEVPEGYSVLYSQPFNRFELPFLTVSGIIDNDKVNLPGSMPFFLQDNFTGIIPAGTPFVQLLPFKREDWTSEHIENDSMSIVKKVIENTKKYRVPNGGVYKNKVWEPRKYE
jgi:hypothetical protein